MELNFGKEGILLSITVKGRLDTITSADFMNAVLENLGDDVVNVAIDCSELTYISSSGLRVFMTIYKKTAPRGGKLILKNLTPQVGEVLNITGMANLFAIE
ncbi:MAG: STAS domain-containing protein [Bacteroidales bacterium]|nr:STAS domain-containing protein [Bacteroidales bacterium]